MDKVNKNLISSSEAAKILKISRIAVFKKIQSGELKAEKIGRNYVIYIQDLERLGDPLYKRGNDAEGVQKAVDRTVKEYKETLELLGKADAKK